MTWKDKDYQARYHREIWYPKNKKRRVEINAKRILKIRNAVSEIKLNRGCFDCGYKEHPEALDFDHLRDKKSMITTAVRSGWSIVRIMEEIEKCEVVCANCHRIRTANRRVK